MITIERYKSTYWAVYENDSLICVTVYKKGAKEVVRRLSASVENNLLEAHINHDKLTKLHKEFKAVNREFSKLITEIKTFKNKPFEAVLYNQNQNKKGMDYLCQQK